MRSRSASFRVPQEGVPLEGIPLEDEEAILELSKKAGNLSAAINPYQRRRRSVDESRRASFNLKIASI